MPGPHKDHGGALLALLDAYVASPYAVIEEEDAAGWRAHVVALISERDAAIARAEAVERRLAAALETIGELRGSHTVAARDGGIGEVRR